MFDSYKNGGFISLLRFFVFILVVDNFCLNAIKNGLR